MSLVFFVCRAPTICSMGVFEQPDLAHLTAEPITMALLDAQDKVLSSERWVDCHLMPLPAMREFTASTILGVKYLLSAPFIFGDEVPFHGVTTRGIISGLDGVV